MEQTENQTENDSPTPLKTAINALATGAAGEAAMESLARAAKSEAVKEGVNPEYADTVLEMFKMAFVRGLALGLTPDNALATANEIFGDADLFNEGQVETGSDLEQLLIGLATGQNLEEALGHIMDDGKGGGKSRALFLEGLQSALSQELPLDIALENASIRAEIIPEEDGNEFLLALAGQAELAPVLQSFREEVSKNVPPEFRQTAAQTLTDSLMEAVAQGKSVSEAAHLAKTATESMVEAAMSIKGEPTAAGLLANALATGENIDTVIEAYSDANGREAFQQALAEALTQGGDLETGLTGAQAAAQTVTAAQNDAATPPEGANALLAVLATGGNIVQVMDAFTGGFTQDGGQAFQDTLAEALAQGGDLETGLAGAQEAAQTIVVAQNETLTPAGGDDSLLVALASGNNIDQAVATLADNPVDTGQIFQNALAAALAEGGSLGSSLANAMESAQEVTAAQSAVATAPEGGNALLAALATGENLPAISDSGRFSEAVAQGNEAETSFAVATEQAAPQQSESQPSQQSETSSEDNGQSDSDPVEAETEPPVTEENTDPQTDVGSDNQQETEPDSVQASDTSVASTPAPKETAPPAAPEVKVSASQEVKATDGKIPEPDAGAAPENAPPIAQSLDILLSPPQFDLPVNDVNSVFSNDTVSIDDVANQENSGEETDVDDNDDNRTTKSDDDSQPTPNQPVLVTDPGNQAAVEDSSFYFDFSGAFSDPDNDGLSYTVVQADGSPLPGWLNVSSGNISGTPANDDVGTITLNITADDGNGHQATLTVDLTVSNTNDLPVSSDFTVSGDEDTAVSFSAVDFEANFSDVDSGDDFTGIKITSLSSDGDLTLKGTTLAVNDEIAYADLGSIIFEPSADFNGSTTFEWVGKDNTGYSESPAVTTINIAAVNDLPVNSDFSVSGNEDTAVSFSAADFEANLSDVDNGDDFTGIKLTALSPDGELKLNGTTLGVDDEIAYADLGSITFEPSADFNGATTFEWVGKDNTDYSESPAVTTINISAVNDLPVSSDFSVSGNEDTAVSFSVADFEANLSDVDNGDDFTGIKLTALSPDGELKLNGTTLGVDDEIAYADLGSITFEPSADFNGSTTFEWVGKDNTDYSESSAVTTINIAAVNDLPVSSDFSVSGG